MTRIKQTSCPLCGSSDANTLYPNGGYCFSCRKRTTEQSIFSWKPPDDERSDGDAITLPYDATNELSPIAVEWFAKYELDVPTLIKHGVLWSEKRQQIIFPFYELVGLSREELCGYQARNFSPAAKSKYFTQGEVNDILPIYHTDNLDFDMYCPCNIMVVVEDCASAIKLSKSVDAMPALGSDLPLYKINRISHLYSRVFVWLDGNMFHKAQRIAERFQRLGIESKAIYTELDPKEYTYAQITSTLEHNSIPGTN